MDPKVMELRIKKWIPLIQEQANSSLTKRVVQFKWHRKNLFLSMAETGEVISS